MMNTTPQRPKITAEIIKKAAEQTSYLTHLDDEIQKKLAELIIRKCNPKDNGYRIARNIEYELDLETELSMEFVETMDEFQYLVSNFYAQACQEWVEENNIQPPFSVGTTITEGEITAISATSPAYYLVKPHGHDDAISNRRLLIKFEDAVAMAVQS